MSIWKKAKNILTTPIPGPIVAGCLTGALLGTTTVLFTLLPVRSPRENISVESISGKNESLEITAKTAAGEAIMGDFHFQVTTLATELWDNATNISTASEKAVIDLVKKLKFHQKSKNPLY